MNSKKNMVMLLLIVSLSCSESLWGMHFKRDIEKYYGHPVMNRLKDSLSIYDPFSKSEIVLFKEYQKTLFPGVYYRTQKGLTPIPTSLTSYDGTHMVSNHLSRLVLADTVIKKMNMLSDNGSHSFSPLTERMCADWARVVVHNDINNPSRMREKDKKFDFYVTIPGVMSKIEYTRTGKKIITSQRVGVFELKLRKTLYDQWAVCYHRHFSYKGIVGAESFGIRVRNKK